LEEKTTTKNVSGVSIQEKKYVVAFLSPQQLGADYDNYKIERERARAKAHAS